MSVTVARPSIVKQWRTGSGSLIGVRSASPLDVLLEVVEGALDRTNASLPDGYMFVGPWATPQGAAFYVDDVDTEQSVLAAVDAIAGALDDPGIDAHIGPLTTANIPWPGRLHNDGYCAAMTIVGRPHWETPGDPGPRRLTQRMWDPDPKARARLIEHAVHWCEKDGARLWLLADVSSFSIPRDQATELLLRIVETGTTCSLIAADSTEAVRRVAFSNNGYVFYEVGGTQPQDWQAIVHDLTDVLVDVHELIEWGCVLHRPAGASGIGPRTNHIVHKALWEPYEDLVETLGYRQDPRRHPEFVLDVYGVQVLGPQHDANHLQGAWHQQRLDHARTLVTATDLDAWFAQPPSMKTLTDARQAFGPLVDPIWTP